ncbi:hypothetical protein AAG906_007952 [Vitis piasezkii]
MAFGTSLSSTNDPITIQNSQDPQHPLLTINLSNITKFSSTNYLTWSLQIQSLLEGYDLHHFIDGTHTPPPSSSLRQDRLIFSALLGAISVSLQPLIARTTTFLDAWILLMGFLTDSVMSTNLSLMQLMPVTHQFLLLSSMRNFSTKKHLFRPLNHLLYHYQQRQIPDLPNPYHVVLDNITTPTWLLDSGASHHVTSDLSNLSLHNPYQGSNDVMIDDGSTFPITHTGFEYIPFCYIPTATKKDCVYEWPTTFPSVTSSSLFAFSSVKTTLSEWHFRLVRFIPEIISNWLLLIQTLPVSNGSLNSPSQRDSSCQHPSQNAQLVDRPSSPIDHLPPKPHNSKTFFVSTITPPTHPMTIRPKNNIHKPLTKINLNVTTMNDEFDVFVWNGNWALVPSTSMQNLVGCHLSEDVHMAQPLGFVDRDNPTHVCKLKKVIYGLKQAPRDWYLELLQFLIEFGFTNSHADTSLFILHSGDIIIYLLVYMDDIIIISTNTNIIQRYIDLLGQIFSIKDLGVLSYFLSIEVLTTPSSVLLTQRCYISDLLARKKMSSAKPVATPLVTDGNLTLHSDWDGNKDDYTSTSAYIVYLSCHPISWSSKKQHAVARSSIEAEYRSIAATTSEIN